MIDYHTTIVNALETILPTYNETVLHRGLDTPCISYMELTNIDDITGDTIGYSRIQYQIKVWSNDIKDLQTYSIAIDKVIRPLGFKRVGSGELKDINSTMRQKILTYEGLAREVY